jgi:hypothetical protein
MCAATSQDTGSYGIVAVDPATSDALVCGDCGRAWLQDITPAGRCPWEYLHGAETSTALDQKIARLAALAHMINGTYSDLDLALAEEAQDFVVTHETRVGLDEYLTAIRVVWVGEV